MPLGEAQKSGSAFMPESQRLRGKPYYKVTS
jgi:hypothetical protein